MRRGDEKTRRIQFSGKSSYMIALPKSWVREMGLRQGDELFITKQSDGSLLISPRRTLSIDGKGAVSIELPQREDANPIVRRLVSLYVVGYNIIHVRAKSGKLTSAQREIVKEATKRHLIGTEVVADSTEEITLQVLLSYPQLSIENALRRMFSITISMHKDAIEALKKLDKDSAEGVIKTDDEVDRFSLYIIRQLKLAVQNDQILKDVGLATRRDCLGF
ncbi:MAG: phosphate uptake regulator PhoU, partial [Nitrososphaerota archaeon]